MRQFFHNLFSKLKKTTTTLTPEGRSPHWPKVRADYLKTHNICECCMKKTKLNVHHIYPFHLYPEYELDPTNFITLCENPGFNCHFVCGHTMNWTAWNPSVVMDVHNLNQKIVNKLFTRLDN